MNDSYSRLHQSVSYTCPYGSLIHPPKVFHLWSGLAQPSSGRYFREIFHITASNLLGTSAFTRPTGRSLPDTSERPTPIDHLSAIYEVVVDHPALCARPSQHLSGPFGRGRSCNCCGHHRLMDCSISPPPPAFRSAYLLP